MYSLSFTLRLPTFAGMSGEITTTVRVLPDLLAALDEIAEREGVSRADIVRRYLESGVRDAKADVPLAVLVKQMNERLLHLEEEKKKAEKKPKLDDKKRAG